MFGNKLVTILITAVIILVFVFAPFAADEEKERLKAETTTDSEVNVKTAETEMPVFSAPQKRPEVFNPYAPERPFEVTGAGYSDDDWAVVCGNCAVGVLVTAKIGKNEYSVQSEGGTFALRIKSPSDNPTILFTQSYQGMPIGKPSVWKGYIETSEASFDPNQAALIGYHNQAFYQKMLPDYEGTNLLSETQKSKLKKKVETLVNKLRNTGNGCELITVFGPSPMTVYPERVPEKYKKAEGTTRLDQLQELFEECGAAVIDLKETFAVHKNDALELYCKYDSHWTDYAGYLAYADLYRYIMQRFPAAGPRPMSDFTWDCGYFNNEDLIYYLGINSEIQPEYSFRRNFRFELPKSLASLRRFSNATSNGYGAYTDQVIYKNTFESGNPLLPNIYVMRNSYSGQMVDLMAERSNRSTFLEMFDYTFNLKDIEEKKPDYLILLISEWDLDKLFK